MKYGDDAGNLVVQIFYSPHIRRVGLWDVSIFHVICMKRGVCMRLWLPGPLGYLVYHG